MTVKEKLIDVANGLKSESIRYPRIKTIDVVNMLINISNMEFDEPDQCVQIAKDYAEAQKEQEAIDFYEWRSTTPIKNIDQYTNKEAYQIFKNR